tara:strand:- start:1584 stop:1718 length:135 start_codon:yes stop_codon:yes gene_type:complete
MKNFFFILFFFSLSSIALAADEKLGRFFEDQPNINDDWFKQWKK